MDTNGADTFLLGLYQHSLEVVDMRVNVTIGEETEEVQSGVVGLDVADQLLPGGGSKHLAGLDGIGDQLSALCEDLTCAECVMTDLGVTHVIVGGQTDSGTVCLEGNHGVLGHQHVQIGGVRGSDRVGNGIGCQTHAVHNDGYNGTLNTVELVELVQCLTHVR